MSGAGKAPVQQKKKVMLMKLTKKLPNQTEAELDLNYMVALPYPKKSELGMVGGLLPVIRGREGFLCCICNLKYDDPDGLVAEDDWVFCPSCFVMLHVTCLRVQKCICGFKPNCNLLKL